jgi:hypothetical protein
MKEAAGFELLLTTDKNLRYQQNLKGRKIAFVVFEIITFHYQSPIKNYVAIFHPCKNSSLPATKINDKTTL